MEKHGLLFTLRRNWHYGLALVFSGYRRYWNSTEQIMPNSIFAQCLRVLLPLSGAVAAIHMLHSLTLDRIIQYIEVPFHSPQIPVALDGYRIAFVTDTHGISERRLNGVANHLNNGKIDLLLLGGDFHHNIERARRTVEILSKIQTTDGIYGVEGNHDTRADLFPVMNAHGITPLFNSGVHVRDNFFLAGTADIKTFWPATASISDAIKSAMPDDFVLLLTHNADITMRQPTTGIDLILSGHTHGGHVSFFGLWAPALTLSRAVTHYGQRFMSGWAKSRDGIPVYVSHGVGGYFPRVFARPQVIIVTLRHQG